MAYIKLFVYLFIRVFIPVKNRINYYFITADFINNQIWKVPEFYIPDNFLFINKTIVFGMLNNFIIPFELIPGESVHPARAIFLRNNCKSFFRIQMSFFTNYKFVRHYLRMLLMDCSMV